MDNNECKVIKDPIYGYIKIPIEYMTNIVDTAEFQRLKRILQTSYAPLYSSAIHNRFVHSIGVFYLGRIVANRLERVNEKKKLIEPDIMHKYAKTYTLACLLHDVGHAPFSHTGEIFYPSDLNKQLKDLVNTSSFSEYIESIGSLKSAAPHEIMSAIIGLQKYSKYFSAPEEKEFFARCITGYLYGATTKERQIKNCFISMLNSKVIDVDRLDYLIRDAYISGFESMNIDYVRLLDALTIITAPSYSLAYSTKALSIIENVVYAHDAERKWIQNHPIVCYEAYIIKHIILNLNQSLEKRESEARKTENQEFTAEASDTSKVNLFCMQALSREGLQYQSGIKVSLLCDDDIVYLFKNVFSDSTGLDEEFFDRQKRRHPIWKSEAEYSAYISSLCQKGILKEEFEQAMISLSAGGTNGIPSYTVINTEYIEHLKKEIEAVNTKKAEMIKALGGKAPDVTMQKSFDVQERGLKRKLAISEFLMRAATERNIDCDFVIISANMFQSNFSKADLGDTLIVFNDGDNDHTFKFNQVCNILKSGKDNKKDNFFYIFYRRKEQAGGENQSKEFSNKASFCRNLFNEATKSIL